MMIDYLPRVETHHHTIAFPGVATDVDNQQAPFLCIDNDRLIHLLVLLAGYAEEGQLPLNPGSLQAFHPLAEQGKQHTYDVRQFGCMPCGLTWVLLAPIWMLEDGEELLPCPHCGPGSMGPISGFYRESLE